MLRRLLPVAHYTKRLLASIKTAELVTWQAKERALREIGVTVAQQAVLTILNDHDGLTSAEIARRAQVTPQTMTSTIGRMERHGLVRRAPHPLHGTLIEIHLTDTGRDLFRRADARLATLDQALACDLSAEELDTLKTLLARVTETVRDGAGTSLPT
jgi:DNA-binding MarR family transcriptional regulator